jgi:hypothetical protein
LHGAGAFDKELEENLMPPESAQQVAELAERIYKQRLRATLEKTHPGMFVAIEPTSGDHFLGQTLSEAGAAARKAHPENPSYIIRIGQKAAVHIGTVK